MIRGERVEIEKALGGIRNLEKYFEYHIGVLQRDLEDVDANDSALIGDTQGQIRTYRTLKGIVGKPTDKNIGRKQDE